MRIIVTSSGADLDAPASPVLGRCPVFVLVDTETMEFEALDNPAIAAAGGAGVQAAQFIVEQGVQAVVTGNVGPNAFQVFQSAGVPVYLGQGGTVRNAVEAFRSGQLQLVGGANAPAHAGMGMGRGVGRGMGRGMSMGSTAGPLRPSPAPAVVPNSGDEEIAVLKDTANNLRIQLAELTERIKQIENPEE